MSDKNKQIAYSLNEDEDDDNDMRKQICDMCGAQWADGEECLLTCPNNESPYAEYLRNGYG